MYSAKTGEKARLVNSTIVKSRAALAAVSLSLLISACGSGSGNSSSSGHGGHSGRGGPNGPVTVGYVVVQQGSAPLEQELPGRIAAYQIADVRPQVNGVVQRRLFREGSLVRQGQTLYQIDPSIYNAQAAQAQANLQSARAQAEAARTLASRYNRSSSRKRSPSRTIPMQSLKPDRLTHRWRKI